MFPSAISGSSTSRFCFTRRQVHHAEWYVVEKDLCLTSNQNDDIVMIVKIQPTKSFLIPKVHSTFFLTDSKSQTSHNLVTVCIGGRLNKDKINICNRHQL